MPHPLVLVLDHEPHACGGQCPQVTPPCCTSIDFHIQSLHCGQWGLLMEVNAWLLAT